MRLVAILLAFALSGCVTAEQRMAQDGQKCASFGARPGSDAYVNCMSQLEAQRRAAVAAIVAGGPSTCVSSGGITNCF